MCYRHDGDTELLEGVIADVFEECVRCFYAPNTYDIGENAYCRLSLPRFPISKQHSTWQASPPAPLPGS
jgi:hypothetical protein